MLHRLTPAPTLTQINQALRAVAIVEADAIAEAIRVRGGCCFGFAYMGRKGVVYRLRGFGNRKDWLTIFDEHTQQHRTFDELTRLKLGAAVRTETSTRNALNPNAKWRRLLAEEQGLHPGGLYFVTYATAASGFCEANEHEANELARCYDPTLPLLN